MLPSYYSVKPKLLRVFRLLLMLFTSECVRERREWVKEEVGRLLNDGV